MQQQPPEQFHVTVVSFQEEVKGWLAFLNKVRPALQILEGYAQLLITLQTYCRSRVLPFDAAAQARFTELRGQGLGVSTRDLRIACIALTTGSTLLSRNLRDFRRVPGLVVEDWTV
jgi:tRNA(fMet)-specific endonuclease VapC